MRFADISRQIGATAALVGVSGVFLVGCQKTPEAPSDAKEPATQSSTSTSSGDQATRDTAAKGERDPNKDTIVIGTTEGDFADMVRNQVQKDLEAKGYTVKLVTFTDYVMPNQALASGDLDINVLKVSR